MQLGTQLVWSPQQRPWRKIQPQCGKVNILIDSGLQVEAPQNGGCECD